MTTSPISADIQQPSTCGATARPLPAPWSYAYRYHDCIRFNGGAEVNGSRPIEAIGVYREDYVRSEADRHQAEIAALREALKPFAGDKMPSLKRSEIDFDRYGLRRVISPMEIAMLRARKALETSNAQS